MGPYTSSGWAVRPVVVGRDGLAAIRRPYDFEQVAERWIVALVLGLAASAATNSFWPGHLDTIAIGLGIVLGAGFVPVIVYGIIAAFAVIVGTATAVARPSPGRARR
jgi:hypothetical protein